MRRNLAISTLVAALAGAALIVTGAITPGDGSGRGAPDTEPVFARGDGGPPASVIDRTDRPAIGARTTSTTTTAPPPTSTTTSAPPPTTTTTSAPPPTTTTTTAPPSPPSPPAAFVCPVHGAVSFTDTWGAARSSGRSHQGVDMMAAAGTPTVAPVGGRVEHRGSSLGGLSWYVRGDDGNTYYGTHLSGYANEGAGWVAAGTVIGYVGQSGNAGTPHLHFEMHPGGGAPVNPYSPVAAVC